MTQKNNYLSLNKNLSLDKKLMNSLFKSETKKKSWASDSEEEDKPLQKPLNLLKSPKLKKTSKKNIKSENVDNESAKSENMESENMESENLENESVKSENVDNESVKSENVENCLCSDSECSCDEKINSSDCGSLYGSESSYGSDEDEKQGGTLENKKTKKLIEIFNKLL